MMEKRMTPTEFDTKLSELRKIEQRVRLYDDKTPIAKVVADQQRAQSLYGQLAAIISDLKDEHL